MKKPLAIDLFCGLGGWTDGLVAEGWEVVGVDIEEHAYGDDRYPCGLIVQDIRTVEGSAFSEADLIVASPPCQEYSYMAMPWTRAKAKAEAIRADKSGAALNRLNDLFHHCFRIQREASEAAGRHIPMIVENVRGAQPWVGRARANFGSFYLWGDVPALMPKAPRSKSPGQDWNRFKENGQVSPHWNVSAVKDAGPTWAQVKAKKSAHWTNPSEGRKQPGIGGLRNNGKGDAWFQDGAARHGSKSSARKRASAIIAKIPLPLARHIAIVFKPERRA